MPKVAKSFLVSGLFRSGTLFLARALDRSPTWRVYQEDNKGHQLLIKRLGRRLREDYYGEVNMHAIPFFERTKTRRKAIIVRDIGDVMLSYFNKRWPGEVSSNGEAKAREFMTGVVNRVRKNLRIMNTLLAARIRCVQFNVMTSDVNYLRDLALFLGPDDIDWSGFDIHEKLNARVVVFERLEDTPKWFREQVEPFAWFTQKWVKG